MGGALVLLAPAQLFLGNGLPELVEGHGRRDLEVLDRPPEVLGPETQPHIAHDSLVQDDEVHLGVVEM